MAAQALGWIWLPVMFCLLCELRMSTDRLWQNELREHETGGLLLEMNDFQATVARSIRISGEGEDDFPVGREEKNSRVHAVDGGQSRIAELPVGAAAFIDECEVGHHFQRQARQQRREIGYGHAVGDPPISFTSFRYVKSEACSA